MNTIFLLNSVLLGVGLAMDAFSVSIADAVSEPQMTRTRRAATAGTFALFQFAMPMIGWILVKTAVSVFGALEAFIPWIALILLVFIGVKMILEKPENPDFDDQEAKAEKKISLSALLLQGVATSIDALSVGFTIVEYDFGMALLACLIIAVVTYGICRAGLEIGSTLGQKLSGKAQIFGGIILILIGIEIFVRGILGI